MTESDAYRRRQRTITFTLSPVVIVTMLLTSGVPFAILATALAGWGLGMAMCLHGPPASGD